MVKAFLNSARTLCHASELHCSVSMRRRRSEMRSHGCCQSRRDGDSTARNLCWRTDRVKRGCAPSKSEMQVRAEPDGVTLAARAAATGPARRGHRACSAVLDKAARALEGWC